MRPALLRLAACCILAVGFAATAMALSPARENPPASEDKAALSKLAAEASEDPDCRPVRRRLWVEERGWVIRRVLVCN